jgi:hypothetical protein
MMNFVNSGARSSGVGASSGATGLQMGTSSTNVKDTVLSIMKEMSKSNKFMHKSDIWTYIQKQTDYNTFEKVMLRLVDDGAIYPTYDNDIYSIGPDY